MKKQVVKSKGLLAILVAIVIFWSNSLGAFAAVCPSPYSPNGYHDYSRHNLRGGTFTVNDVHDVYTGTYGGVDYYETCYIVKTKSWCVVSCAFCGREDPSHFHDLGETHTINHKR